MADALNGVLRDAAAVAPRPRGPGVPTARTNIPDNRNARATDERAEAAAFQPGPFSGPARWGFDDDFAGRIARLRVFITGSDEKRDVRVSGDAREALKLYTLHLQRSSTITFQDVMARQAVPAELLDCEYRRSERVASEKSDAPFKPEYIKVFFWQVGARKSLSAKMLSPYQNKSDQIADVELGTCPPDFASALTAGFGATGWVDRAQQAIQARDKFVQTQYALGQWNPVDYSGWADKPRLLSLEEQRGLAREMDQVLKRHKPMTQPYYVALNQQLQPAMAKLAASGIAQAQAIPKGEAGRKAFEQWDAGVGSAVVSLALRVQAAGQPTNLFVHVQGRYLAIYREQIADKGALEPAYLTQMLASIEKYKTEQANVQAPTAQTQRTYQVLVLRPPQTALYRMVNTGVKAIQQFAQGRAEIERYLTTLDADIRETRTSFWACYAKRCTEGGVLFYKLSVLLADFDRFQIARTAQEGAISRAYGDAQHGRTAMALLGMDRQVDEQYTSACAPQYDRFLAQFVKWMRLDPTAMRRELDAALASDDYLAVQQCRDQMSFILRPRAPSTGLL